MSTAQKTLVARLRVLLDAGVWPPCCVDPDDGAWLSESPRERARAAKMCRGCPLLTECVLAADENGETFGVWAGADRGRETSTGQAA